LLFLLIDSSRRLLCLLILDESPLSFLSTVCLKISKSLSIRKEKKLHDQPPLRAACDSPPFFGCFLLLRPRLWYLPRYVCVGLFWAFLASSLIARPQKSSSTHMIWACKVEICKNTQNKQNHT